MEPPKKRELTQKIPPKVTLPTEDKALSNNVQNQNENATADQSFNNKFSPS